MTALFKWIRKLNWHILLFLCIIPGLTPFIPPHLFEKIILLVQGRLVRALDWFDLFFHGFPWLLALIKLILTIRKEQGEPSP